jgi:hypothetical protein
LCFLLHADGAFFFFLLFFLCHSSPSTLSIPVYVPSGGSKRARRSSSASDSHSSDAGSQSGSGSGSGGDGDGDSDGSAPAPKRGRDRGKKTRGAAGDAAAADTEKPKKPVLLVPRTMESEREADHTVVEADDEEAGGGEGLDEFARYFAGADKEPRLLLTTSQKPSAVG